MAIIDSAKPFIAMALMSVLAACTTSGGGTDDRLGRLLVAPGKYVLYSCPELATQATATAARLRELERLMAKAGSDSGGQLVSAMAYRPEYTEKRGEMSELRNAAVEKNCKSHPGAGAPAGRTSDNAVR